MKGPTFFSRGKSENTLTKFLNLLLNRWVDFNRIGTKHSCVKGIQVCSNEEQFNSHKVSNVFFLLLIKVIINSNRMCLLIWTVFSGVRWCQWASCLWFYNQQIKIIIFLTYLVNCDFLFSICNPSVWSRTLYKEGTGMHYHYRMSSIQSCVFPCVIVFFKYMGMYQDLLRKKQPWHHNLMWIYK